MAKLILFSGGCNSGKTTTLKAVASKLQSFGYEVKILNEIIRKETDKPIDELRKDAKSYLQLQNKIIRAKLEQEIAAINDETNCIYLADRAATDSLFYLENYVDKSQLDEESIKLFCNLHYTVHNHLLHYFSRYHLVVEFMPLKVQQLDIFRPAYIDIMKKYESRCISRLNIYYSNGNCCSTVMCIDLNCTKQEEAINKIIKHI